MVDEIRAFDFGGVIAAAQDPGHLGNLLSLLIGICFLAAQPPRWRFSRRLVVEEGSFEQFLLACVHVYRSLSYGSER